MATGPIFRGLALATGLTAIALVVTWPLTTRFESGVSDFGDPLLTAWILAWVAHALAARLPLFEANIFFPEPNALAFSEPLLVPALLVAPLQWVGADPILAQNVLLITGYTLSGLAVFLLVQSLTGDSLAAVVSAVAIVAVPYRTEVLAHVQLQLVWWVPLALWRVHLLTKGGRQRDGLLAGLCLALQAYTCVYYGIYGAMFFGLAAVVWALRIERGRRAAFVRGVMVAAVTAGLLMLPLALALRSASAAVGERSLADVGYGSAIVSDYLQPHPDNLLYGRPERPGTGERRLFPGYTLPLLALPTAVLSASAAPFTAATAGSFLLSLGTGTPVYGWLHERVQPLRALRVPARLAMFVFIGGAVLAGIGFAQVTRRRHRTTRIVAALLLSGSFVLEGLNRPLEYSALPEASPSVYAWLAGQPPSVVCEYPLGNVEGRSGPQDPTYQYYSTKHWHRLVNGYSGFLPVSYQETQHMLASFPDDAAIERLRSIGTDLLLVHSRFYIRGNFEADVNALVANDGLSWVGMFAWRDGARTAVFRLRPS